MSTFSGQQKRSAYQTLALSTNAAQVTYFEGNEMAEEKKEDPYMDLKNRDSLVGLFNIEFVGPRRMRIENVRIVHWKMSPNAELFYLIDENGSVYNFANINVMSRIGD